MTILLPLSTAILAIVVKLLAILPTLVVAVKQPMGPTAALTLAVIAPQHGVSLIVS